MKPVDVQIEPFREVHIRSFHEAVDMVAREKSFLARTEAPPIEETEKLVRENIHSKSAYYVAVVSGQVIGWCLIVQNPREVFSHCGTLGMGVVKDFRGKGIGSSLIKAALSKAKANGMERVELEVFDNNTTAIKLYEKIGFKMEGRKARAAKLCGEYLDLVLMALLLSEYKD
jgi:RimJ/RimL family protein N-acetyltransferase